MTSLTHTALPLRSRSRSKSLVRTALDRFIELRGQEVRRHALTPLVHGFDRFDVSDIERRSLFDMAARERR